MSTAVIYSHNKQFRLVTKEENGALTKHWEVADGADRMGKERWRDASERQEVEIFKIMTDQLVAGELRQRNGDA